MGTGQADVFDPKQVLDLVSQHCTPPGTDGQLFWQSESVVQDGAHFFSGVGAFEAGGTVVAGAGSVAAEPWSSAGMSALLAQAAATRPNRIAVTAKADFEKVEYVTKPTLNQGQRKKGPDRLTKPIPMSDRDPSPEQTPELGGKDAAYIGAADDSETRKKRVPEGRAGLLGLLLLLLVGAFLFSPAIVAPLFLDDYLQGAMVEGTFPATRSPFDLYAFVDDGDRAALSDRGLLPWWTDSRLTIRFFRPLSSGLLWIDHRVLSHAPFPMHLHSLAWWVAAVLAARLLFKRLLAPRVALFATVIFALAPCHALPLAWVANRETLVSLVFGALALVAQARWRDDRRLRDAGIAGALFALAMAGGGEYALCFGGYVVAMDLGRRGESLARRVAGWLPFVVPAVTYLAVRGSLGYGTAASGFYSDPVRESGAFLMNAPWRAVRLLAIGWLTLDSEQWRLGVARWLLAGIVVVAMAAIALPIRRAFAALEPRQRAALTWLLVGSLLALIPTLAVVPARRLLGVSMLGVSALVALLLERAWFPRADEPGVSRGRAASLASLVALGLGFAHLVHGPGTSWLASEQHRADASDFDGRVAWVRARVGDPTQARVGVIRGTAAVFFAPFALDRRGVTPARWRVLTQAGHVLALRRDLYTLDLVATLGRGLYPIGERNLYRSADSPLHVGDEIVVKGMRVTILEVGEAGPRSARFVFDEDPTTLLWLSEMFEATQEVELPGVDFGAPFDP